jgi:hypothetical protein
MHYADSDGLSQGQAEIFSHFHSGSGWTDTLERDCPGVTSMEPERLSAATELWHSDYWPVATYPKGVIMPNGRISDGKPPIGSGWGLVQKSPDQLREIFNRYPDAGVGICLGPARAPGGGWLIDLEGDGPEAEESLIGLLGGELVETPSWRSTRGPHILFIADGPRLLDLLAGAGAEQGDGAATWHLDEFPGIEWRVSGFGPGGTVKQLQSIVPPTDGTDGKPREWIVPPWVEVAPLPEAAYAALETIAERKAIQEEGCSTVLSAGTPATLSAKMPGRSYGEAALAAECDAIRFARPGNRHNTVRDSAIKIASLSKADTIDWGHARGRLLDAARGCGLPEMEAVDLIDSGWAKAGVRKVTHILLTPPDRKKDMCVTSGDTPGSSLGRARSRMADVAIPPDLEAKPRLIGVFRAHAALGEEARRRGGSTYHVSSRQLAELSGLGPKKHKTALRHSEALGRMGLLSLIKPGTPSGPKRKAERVDANVYRLHNPPQPGKTVWNSNKTASKKKATSKKGAKS